ncbi:hypothetical protein MIC448_1650017 [Microbacterium sp. C448]|nr:hypothetical protein MIC448_1650017 [Microbacterium sp. C448]
MRARVSVAEAVYSACVVVTLPGPLGRGSTRTANRCAILRRRPLRASLGPSPASCFGAHFTRKHNHVYFP